MPQRVSGTEERRGLDWCQDYTDVVGSLVRMSTRGLMNIVL